MAHLIDKDANIAKGCGIEFPYFGANYPDARCIDGYLLDMDSGEATEDGINYSYGGNGHPCPVCNTKEWLEQVMENEGFDTEEDALAYVEQLKKHYLFIDTLEVKEVDLYNNGWIDCTKQMPQETKQTSDTLQGHREWTESDRVLVWDSMYGCSVDATKNGKWMSEQRGGYTGQVVHGIIAWRPIPEFSEELLFKAQKG